MPSLVIVLYEMHYTKKHIRTCLCHWRLRHACRASLQFGLSECDCKPIDADAKWRKSHQRLTFAAILSALFRKTFPLPVEGFILRLWSWFIPCLILSDLWCAMVWRFFPDFPRFFFGWNALRIRHRNLNTCVYWRVSEVSNIKPNVLKTNKVKPRNEICSYYSFIPCPIYEWADAFTHSDIHSLKVNGLQLILPCLLPERIPLLRAQERFVSGKDAKDRYDPTEKQPKKCNKSDPGISNPDLISKRELSTPIWHDCQAGILQLVRKADALSTAVQAG